MPIAGVGSTVRCSIGCGASRLQQVAQLTDGLTRLGELELEPIEMLDDQPVARVGVRRGENRLDIRDRHLQAPESADHLGERDLVLGVVAIAVVRVDFARLEQPDLVVVAQRLDAEVRRAGEVADRDARPHGRSIDPPPAGGSSRHLALDSPVGGRRNVLSVAVPTATRLTIRRLR